MVLFEFDLNSCSEYVCHNLTNAGLGNTIGFYRFKSHLLFGQISNSY